MPRYDDRYSSNTRLYVGHLSSRTCSRDLEHIFGRYGRVRNVDMKRDYAFVDFSDPRDADDAKYYLDGRDVDGRRITVEFAKGIPRGPGGVREYGGRGSVPGTGRCFNCGIDGHWARDCRAGDWKNKCYHCGERGHIERNCPNSPKKLSSRSGGSHSLSPVRSPSPRHGQNRDRSFSRSRSYRHSRSPARRERDAKNPSSKSPEPRRATSSKQRKCSPSPDNNNPRKKGMPSPIEEQTRQTEQEKPDRSNGPKENNQSSSPPEEDSREPRHGYGYIDSPKENRQSDSPNEDTMGLDQEDGCRHSPKEAQPSPDPIEEDTREPTYEDGCIDSPNENGRSHSPIKDTRGGLEQECRDDGPKETSQSPPGETYDDSECEQPRDGNTVGLPPGSESSPT